MNILLHTIALEPARWTPARVSLPLVELLPRIAKADFREIEVFKSHLTAEIISPEIRDAIADSGLMPIVLSSYLDLDPAATADSELSEKIDEMAERVDYYGFQKVRLFPGLGMNPDDRAGVRAFTERVRRLVERVPNVEVLLGTHDGSLADDPEVIVGIVEELAEPNVGLLFQATFFEEQQSIREQFRIEKPYIRHIHLQNRLPDLSFVGMKEGIIPWPDFLKKLDDRVDVSLEFVPVGVCGVDEFDLEATLRQARKEADYVRSLLPKSE